jgi:SOS-response transcriptional repressor LexA
MPNKTKPVRPEYLAVGQRIKACMESRNLDQSTVARALGIEPQSVQQWIQGQTNPRGYRIKALAALLEVEPWELLGTSTTESSTPTKSSRSSTIDRIPRVSWVSAGHFREIAPSEHVEEWDTPSEPMTSNSFSLRVEGDSMEPEFPNGCVIFVDPQTQPLNGDYVVVTLDDTHHATFKQLVLDGAQRYLKPLNPRYPIIPITSEARVCGVVREMRKAFRRQPST